MFPNKSAITRTNAIIIVAIVIIAAIAGGAGWIYYSKPVEKTTVVEKTTLVYETAGDINMLALAQNVLGPEFEKRNPNVKVVSVHTGPGDAGDTVILEKLKAEKDAGKDIWDVDVAMVHQVFMGDYIKNDLILNYSATLDSWKYVTTPQAKNALGTNVNGYVMPMFNSQVAIAYNPKYVTNVPSTYEDLVSWVKANPGKFGYNGIKGGMSGVGFVTGWLYWKTGKYNLYAVTGPYDKANEQGWDQVFADLKDFNKYVTLTAGNVGTLDSLNRGEIWMGPVWVDMFYTSMLDGKMDPNIKLLIPKTGLPGQPMYFVIPKKARNIELAKKFVDMVMSPDMQGSAIIVKYNWYPGIDGKYVQSYVTQDVYKRLYGDIPPEMLLQRGLAFPLSGYMLDMGAAYDKYVSG
jgi:putative spermidine/putrescine transport system substrate-binding protein